MRIPFVPVDGLCRRCGRDAVGLDGEFLCEDCRTFRPAYDRVASAARYEDDARELVNAFKFRNAVHLRDDLVDFLEGACVTRFKTSEIDLVVPMPSTFAHRFWRGYNQCAYLARELARRLGRPYRAAVLKRVGRPKKQGGLREEERRTNVLGTFAVRTPAAVRGRCVLVVDDIMTTGSTLAECARTLKAAGAKKVWAATLARSLHT